MKHNKYLVILLFAFAVLNPTFAMDVNPGSYKVDVQSSLIVRDAPKDGNKIGSLYNDNSVEVLECNNGWAKIKYGVSFGYVKSDYLRPSESPKIDIDDNSMDNMLYGAIDGLKSIMPFVILALVLLMWLFLSLDKPDVFKALCGLLGLSELILFIPIGEGSGGSIPSFCEPNNVGWIFAIINFIIMVVILLFQYYIYRGFTRDLEFGFWKNLFFTVFMFWGMLSFCAIFTVSFYSVVIFAIFFVILLFILKGVPFSSTLFFTLNAFGLLLSFLNALGALIIGGIIWFILNGMTQNDSPKRERYRIEGTDIIVEQVSGDDFRDIRTNEPWKRTGYRQFQKV